MSSRDLFGAEEIEAEAVPEGKKQLVERKRLIAQLITSTVLKYNVNARTNTALFWFISLFFFFFVFYFFSNCKRIYQSMQ